ncbi:MAG: hypothetical protein QOE79_870 [Sphingomonadales bacterium]|nr:hypothetical protein [Sphingomonadales bacterium]MEA3048689.1 hypothetical protein [Sphingomonadales bacterium]
MTGGEKAPAPPPDGPQGHDTLEDAAEEALREIEKRRDGSGGYAGEGDVG